MDRRRFIQQAVGVAGLAAVGVKTAFPRRARKVLRPTDRVELGKTGIKLSVVGVGTGTIGFRHSSNQTRLGQEAFTRIIRHAYDSGINFFDCADQYGSHPFLKKALKGIPRDKIVIQSKIWSPDGEQAQKDLERFLKELGVDYIDMVLCHCVRRPDWPQRRAGVMEVLSKAKEKGIIRAHGVSVHGMAPLRVAAENKWLDHGFFRLNHVGKRAKMDGPPAEVVPLVRKVRESGRGVLAMKILGEGTIKDQLDKSLRFVFGLGCVDAIVVGFEKPSEIDDLLKRAEAALRDAAKAAAA